METEVLTQFVQNLMDYINAAQKNQLLSDEDLGKQEAIDAEKLALDKLTASSEDMTDFITATLAILADQVTDFAEKMKIKQN